MDPEELRLECVTLAVEAGAHPECVVEVARSIEAFVLGDDKAAVGMYSAFAHS